MATRRTTARRPAARPAARTSRAAVKVYVNGALKPDIRAGRTAGEFGKAGSHYVLMSKTGSRVVNGDYVLKGGETLVVSQRGVGG